MEDDGLTAEQIESMGLAVPAGSGKGTPERIAERITELRSAGDTPTNAISVSVIINFGPDVPGVGALHIAEGVTADGVLFTALPPGVKAATMKRLVGQAAAKALGEVPTGQRARKAKAPAAGEQS